MNSNGLAIALSTISPEEAKQTVLRANALRKAIALIEAGENGWSEVVIKSGAHTLKTTKEFPMTAKEWMAARLAERGYEIIASKERGCKKRIYPKST